jgi:hypothetical protein
VEEEGRQGMKRRLGQFSIPSHIITHQPAEAKAILRNVIVYRAEHMFHKLSVEYIGLSDSFDEIAEGEEAPIYSWSVEELGPDVVRVRWERWA